jgi:hypothetical protein
MFVVIILIVLTLYVPLFFNVWGVSEVQPLLMIAN